MWRKPAATAGVALALFLSAIPAFAQARDGDRNGGNGDRPGDFDFYVLSLSWSPSYCALEGPRANRQQCGTRRPFGFVVHGLWPQNEWGYPANCRLDGVRSQGGYVPRNLISSLSDIMPSAGLVGHQWRKHGSCSGLSQSDYFATLRQAYGRLAIPPSLRRLDSDRRVDPALVEKAFIAANPGLKPDGISVTCRRNHLQEVRICMTKDLRYRACQEVDKASCRSRSLTMPATQ